MSEQSLKGIYPIVLPKPNEDFEQSYYSLLDNGWFELDRQTKDATELLANAELPYLVDEIPKVGFNIEATDWAETMYFKLLSEERCLYDDEYWQIVRRLPDFFAAAGSKQKMKNYLIGINQTTFLDLMDGMPVYRLNLPNPAIPNYSLKGKGYHPENTADWLNFDKNALLKCTNNLSEETISILAQKYLKSDTANILLSSLLKDIEQLKVKQNGNEPNGHLIIKYDIENRTYLMDSWKIHVLEDFVNWVNFWTSKKYPIGFNIRFLVED